MEWKPNGPTNEETVDLINELDLENSIGFRGAYEFCNDSNGEDAICDHSDEFEEDVS